MAWVPIHRPGELRRYVLTGGKEDPTVVLAQREADGDVWRAGLQMPDGSKQLLVADVGMETAQGVGEDWVRKHRPDTVRLSDVEAAWRKRKPSAKQLAAAAKWRMKVDPSWTAGELSDAMSAHIARRKGANR